MSPSLMPSLAAFSVFEDAAIITPPGGAPVTTVVIGADSTPRVGTVLTPAAGGFDGNSNLKRHFRIQKSALASVPNGTVIQVTEGVFLGTYTVDRVDSVDPEYHDAVVR